MATLDSIVIVGASLAGVRAAEALRAGGYDGRVVMVGAEPHLPYDRPPLSKEVLRGEWGPDRLGLRREGLLDLDLDLRLGCRAVGLDLASRRVLLDGATGVEYGGLVITTGAQPRRIRIERDLVGVHVLRSLDDALALRADLERGPRVVIVGAGFIGLEVAASCRALGLAVTIVEPQRQPLAALLGEAMGDFFAGVHRDHGVDVRTGVAVAAVEGGTRVERVRLADGSTVAADVVVVGIGATPATDWLVGSGLDLDDGVICDSSCRTSAPGVVAAGDVARWLHPLYRRHIRVEHWTNAAEQGAAAAQTLLAGSAAPVYDAVPSFWSDQYDLKAQFAGLAAGAAETHVIGDVAQRRFVTLYGHEGRLTGVLAVRRAAQFVRYSQLLASGTVGWEQAIAGDR